MRISDLGFAFGVTAFMATVAFGVVQSLQLVGILEFPAAEILIYGTSLCITVPFVLEMVALHHLTEPDRRFWTHAALVFTILYAVFVIANYAVQLGTVIPAKMRGSVEALAVLDQTPHSMFWIFDAVGYISMGVAALLVVPAVANVGFERLVRWSLIAHAVVTPLIAVVYFYPGFSTRLLLLGLPWAITAPLFMLMLAVMLRRR